jgi:hypothetical protein
MIIDDAGPGVAGELRPRHQDRQRQVERDVDPDPVDRAEAEQQGRADHRAGQHAERPRGRVEPDRAGQVLDPDEVLEQQLLGRRPQRARRAVQDQQDAGVPDRQRVREEQDAPGQRHGHEQRL